MDIRELESVCAVDTYRSYTEAAYRISSSPAVISKHVQRVESEFGVRLFERASKSRPVQLTPQGAALIGYFHSMLNIYKHATLTAQELRSGQRELLTVGYVPFIGNFREHEMLARFSVDNPDVTIRRKAEGARGLVRMLTGGVADAVFIPLLGEGSLYSELSGGGYELIRLLTNRTLTIGLPDWHPLANASEITPDKYPLLHNETFIFSSEQQGPEGNDQRNNIYKLLRFTEPMKTRFIDYSEPTMPLQLVESGAGVLPQACIVPRRIGNVSFVPVAGENTVCPTLYFACRSEGRSAPLEKLRNTVLEFAREA